MSEVYIARLAVAVFGDDGYPQPLCRISALLVRCQVCQCRAIEQNHQVGILLDGAALTQIRQFQASVRPVFGAAVELAQQDDRYVQFLGQQLGFTAGLCHLLFPVPVVLFGAHVAQLQIVDDDKVALAFALQQPCA